MPGTVGPGRARAPESIAAGLLFCGRCRRDRACFRRCSWRRRRLGRRLARTGRCSRFARRTAQLAPLLLRQAVVLLPLLLQPLFLVGRQLFHLLIALARRLAFLGGELDPSLHAPLRARLLVGFHLGITLGDPEPLARARWLEFAPVDRKRRENRLFLVPHCTPR